jgi:threonylcarbamoyladenosine tRNA methylthiotransferase MtaB
MSIDVGVFTMKKTDGKTYKLRVLGCKVNQYEACQIEQRLGELGFEACAESEPSDLVIVHGCAVTAVAGRKSRQALRRLRRENPSAQLIMTGCSAVEPAFDADTEACRIVPPGDELLAGIEKAVRAAFDAGFPETDAACRADLYPLAQFAERTRAFLKIQDGCSIGCSYCIVPSLRGRPRDKQPDAVLREARLLVANGYRELVVAGVSVGLYGSGGADCSLAEILRRLSELDGLERIRMSSLHPQEVTDELLSVWASSPRFMPHVHLPLQAGSNRVLDAMHRGYTREEFISAIERFRAVLDTPAFTTDVIVGFPGEREEDFAQTVEIAEAVGFSKMHIFPYSERPGTLAAKMGDKVPAGEARRRAGVLQEKADEMASKYFARFIGRCEQVLIEQELDDGWREGRGEHYFPVRFHAPQSRGGDCVAVHIEEVEDDGTRGQNMQKWAFKGKNH